MQSYWQLAAGLGVALALSACASNTDAVLTTYDAQSQARIRLFGQNQKPTIMDVCQPSGKTQRINVGGSMGDAFSSFTRTASNHSLGIAPSETTRQLARQDGILSKALYREFAIPAGKLPLSAHCFTGWRSPAPTARIFAAGKPWPIKY